MDIKNLLIDEIKKIRSWETERKFKTDEANEYRAEVLGWLERFLTCIESSELENDDYRELAKLFKDDVSGRIEQMQENMTYEKYLADIEELGEKKDSIPDFYKKRQINPDCMELGALRVDIEQGIPVELDELRRLDDEKNGIYRPTGYTFTMDERGYVISDTETSEVYAVLNPPLIPDRDVLKDIKKIAAIILELDEDEDESGLEIHHDNIDRYHKWMK